MSYTQNVTISSSTERVFKAITENVQEWWGNTDHPVREIGDHFTTSFDKTFWKFKLLELIPFSKIVWQCIDARHIHPGYTGIEKEWIGTTIQWNISSISDDECNILFQHNGLTPDLNCFEICTPAWDRFVTKSLKSFVESGEGMPHKS